MTAGAVLGAWFWSDALPSTWQRVRRIRTPTSHHRAPTGTFPAFFPRPRGTLYAVAGINESDEFLRQNQLIRDQWGPTSVPICETVPGRHHLDVLHDLADPQARLHDLALRLLGLR